VKLGLAQEETPESLRARGWGLGGEKGAATAEQAGREGIFSLFTVNPLL